MDRKVTAKKHVLWCCQLKCLEIKTRMSFGSIVWFSRVDIAFLKSSLRFNPEIFLIKLTWLWKSLQYPLIGQYWFDTNQGLERGLPNTECRHSLWTMWTGSLVEITPVPFPHRQLHSQPLFSSPVATTSAQRPVFRNTKSYQVKPL